MLIKDQKHIADIQADFRRLFPYLKLEFYNLQHEAGEGSPKRALLPSHKLLSEVRTVHNEGDLTILPEMTVNELENKFSDLYGLNAQVFRRSGNLWMQTTVTDSWTLAEQNRKGGVSEAFFEEMHNSEQKSEDDNLLKD